MRLIGLALVMALGTASADDLPVNLLVSVPTTVAVSSTVDNAQLKPEHLVDGVPTTAWNSRTGELAGAWIAFRVPATARVTAIKLTAGFTHVDKKLGDLFTQNPRIKQVRITRDGKPLGDFPLDIRSRALQELTLDAPGGDFRISVLAYEPGSKKAWREIAVSELEVWGTTPAPAKRQRPAVRIGSLDAHPTLSKAECLKAVFAGTKRDGRVVRTEEIGLSADTTLCRIETAPSKDELTVTLAAVQRASKKLRGTPVLSSLDRSTDHDGTRHEDTVAVTRYALTRNETGVLVAVTARAGGEHATSETTTTTLYRVDASGLTALLDYESKRSSTVESRDSDVCELPEIVPGAAMPKKLKLACVASYDDYHNDDPDKRGTFDTLRTEVFVWDGTTYDKP